MDYTATLAVANRDEFTHEPVKHVTQKDWFLQECVQCKILLWLLSYCRYIDWANFLDLLGMSDTIDLRVDPMAAYAIRALTRHSHIQQGREVHFGLAGMWWLTSCFRDQAMGYLGSTGQAVTGESEEDRMRLRYTNTDLDGEGDVDNPGQVYENWYILGGKILWKEEKTLRSRVLLETANKYCSKRSKCLDFEWINDWDVCENMSLHFAGLESRCRVSSWSGRLPVFQVTEEQQQEIETEAAARNRDRSSSKKSRQKQQGCFKVEATASRKKL